METSALPESPVAATPAGEPQAMPRPCPAPANLRAEIARYDREATVRTWAGPRYRMTYRVLGEGPPLILVPGLAGSHRPNALLLNQLSSRFQTISYDYPGDREDDRARLGRISHAHLVDDLLGLIDHLELVEPSILGLSFGSSVVLRALAQRPDLSIRAAVQGAFANRPFTTAERLAGAIGRRLPGGARAQSIPGFARVLEYNHKSHYSRLIVDRWKLFLEDSGQTPIRSLAHRFSLSQGLDSRPILGRIKAEVLVLQGNEDRLVHRQLHQELVEGIPNARSVVMPNVGHQPQLTHAEAMAEALSQWYLRYEAAAHPCESGSHEEGCGGDPRNCLGEAAGTCRGTDPEHPPRN